jgi:hypothetical protein
MKKALLFLFLKSYQIVLKAYHRFLEAIFHQKYFGFNFALKTVVLVHVWEEILFRKWEVLLSSVGRNQRSCQTSHSAQDCLQVPTLTNRQFSVTKCQQCPGLESVL